MRYWRIDCIKDNVCPIGVLEEKSEWSYSEVINEGVVAENIWGEIADDQMQREKDLKKKKRKRPYSRPKKRLFTKKLLASAEAKTRDGRVEASKSNWTFYTKLICS